MLHVGDMHHLNMYRPMHSFGCKNIILLVYLLQKYRGPFCAFFYIQCIIWQNRKCFLTFVQQYKLQMYVIILNNVFQDLDDVIERAKKVCTYFH